MTLHFLNDVANDAESTQKSIITSYSLVSIVHQLNKVINRIPGSRLLTSSFPGMASITLFESIVKPRDVHKRFKSLVWLT